MLSTLLLACSDTPLHVAAAEGRIAALRRLAERIPLDTVDSASQTPLHRAAAAKQLRAVKLLLELGASTAAAEITGFTALHFAAAGGSLPVASALLGAGSLPLEQKAKEEEKSRC